MLQKPETFKDMYIKFIVEVIIILKQLLQEFINKWSSSCFNQTIIFINAFSIMILKLKAIKFQFIVTYSDPKQLGVGYINMTLDAIDFTISVLVVLKKVLYILLQGVGLCFKEVLEYLINSILLKYREVLLASLFLILIILLIVNDVATLNFLINLCNKASAMGLFLDKLDYIEYKEFIEPLIKETQRATQIKIIEELIANAVAEAAAIAARAEELARLKREEDLKFWGQILGTIFFSLSTGGMLCYTSFPRYPIILANYIYPWMFKDIIGTAYDTISFKAMNYAQDDPMRAFVEIVLPFETIVGVGLQPGFSFSLAVVSSVIYLKCTNKLSSTNTDEITIEIFENNPDSVKKILDLMTSTATVENIPNEDSNIVIFKAIIFLFYIIIILFYLINLFSDQKQKSTKINTFLLGSFLIFILYAIFTDIAVFKLVIYFCDKIYKSGFLLSKSDFIDYCETIESKRIEQAILAAKALKDAKMAALAQLLDDQKRIIELGKLAAKKNADAWIEFLGIAAFILGAFFWVGSTPLTEMTALFNTLGKFVISSTIEPIVIRAPLAILYMVDGVETLYVSPTMWLDYPSWRIKPLMLINFVLLSQTWYAFTFNKRAILVDTKVNIADSSNRILSNLNILQEESILSNFDTIIYFRFFYYSCCLLFLLYYLYNEYSLSKKVELHFKI